ncbi:MAG: C25 family cysteine peptidase [Saprospiraceae bacterium]
MNNKILLLFFGIIVWFVPKMNAQMITGNDTLYGNEWINYNQAYFKIKVAEDGMYRLDYNALNNAGVFSGTAIPQGQNLQLLKNGKPISFYVSEINTLTSNDFLTFYGEKNRGEVDKFLYDDPTYQVNREYSLYTDTSVYYLTYNVNTVNPLIINEIPNDLTNLPPKEIYCWFTKTREWNERLSVGIDRGGSGHVSAKYDLGEGYTKNTYSANQSNNVGLSNRYSTNVPNAEFEVQLLAQSGNHQTEIQINNITYVNDTFSNWAVKNYHISVPMSATSGSSPVRIIGNASADDKYRIAFIKAKYPRVFKFSNVNWVSFEMDSSWQRQYFEIQNFTYGTNPPILYDLTNGTRINTQIANNRIVVAVPASTQSRQFILVADNAYKISSIESVQFMPFQQNQGGNYILLTHSKLFDDGTGFNHVQDYANYRASTLGGNHTPIIVDIDQVYEQFGYGIDRHEQAIRNFVQWAAKHWSSEYLFIIGKGVYYGKYRNGNADFENYELVPSFGYPSSDNLLAAKPNTDEPVLAVGRIAAYTPDMLSTYLDKIKEVELAYQTAPQTIEDRAWQKSFLHLGGGDPDIQDFIKGRLVDMEDTIKQSQLGASVLGYYKNSTNVIQSANSDDVTRRINEGLAWITFFGHSAPNTLDFDIGDPNQYNNKGKYPMIYAMGCNTNRLLESPSTLSETYVFVENRGAIGFIGSTATTSLSDLNQYGRVLYKNLGDDNYGQTIGKVMKSTIEEYPLSGFWGRLVKHNIFLHGDPAMKIYPQEGVDYIVNKEKTTINPKFVNVQLDSFQLDLVVANIGYAVEDSIHILIEQQYPNGTKVELKTIQVKSPDFEETYTTWLLLENKEVIGTNELHITVDVDNEVVESPSNAESNNTTIIPFSIISNSAKPIYPYEYSIINEPTITLKASTSNILTDNIQYYIEIDTTNTFDSPIKLTTQKESNGGLITWQPIITLQDSTVYYWRISMDSILTSGNGFDWQYSSFIYISESLEGWNQSHFYQKTNAIQNDIDMDSTSYTNIFGNTTSEFKVINGAVGILNWAEIALYIDGFRFVNYWPCPSNAYSDHATFWILGFDKDKHIYSNINGTGGQYNCWQNPNAVYIKGMDDITERQEAINFLQNNIPENDYVVVFTTQKTNSSYHANQWAADSLTLGTNIFQVLEDEGATQIRNLATNETPYIFIFQKGNSNWEGQREVHANTVTEIIQATTILTGKQTQGSITSTPIGPAKFWGDVKWQVSDFNPTEDTISLDIIGVTVDGVDSVLMTNTTLYDISLDFVNPNIFPYLKLRYNVKDETSLTPAQLDYWRVFYQPLPDAALNPQDYLVFHADTIEQGDEFKFEIGVENISNTAMDSLLVKYTITNAVNEEVNILTRNEALLGDSSIVAKLNLDTRNRSGNHLVNIEVNPDNDQPEMYKFNNVGVASFYIEKDNTAPILDVTFDGVHIMSGDIISSKPNILIALEDENPFIALDDTSTFELYIVSPSGVSTRYYVDNQTVIFRPADNNDLENKNRAEIEFLPEFMEDGTYQLQVKAKDATNNQSGANEYKIDFEVITKAMISNVLNYPNPFSTSTQFVFTLTGAEIPEAMNIQIFTVSGKVIRTITKEELGDIRVGLNRTEYTWDGTDDFGNRLANGVYLYRVNLKSATEENYELFNTGTNDYFKGGFGKMVILR